MIIPILLIRDKRFFTLLSFYLSSITSGSLSHSNSLTIFEIYQEELNTFLKQMPEGMLKAEEERQQINAILQEIRHEKRIVNRIVEEERSLNKEQKISKTERTEIRHRR